MSQWQGYADLTGPPGYVRVTLGQFSQHEALVLDWDAPVAHRMAREESTRIDAAHPLELDTELAEALYKALDRIFGNHHEEGVTDVLREALTHERARVDQVLSRVPVVISNQPVATDTVG